MNNMTGVETQRKQARLLPDELQTFVGCSQNEVM